MKKLLLFIFFPMLVFAKEKPAIGSYFNQKNDTIYYKEIFYVDSTISEDTLHDIAMEYLHSISLSRTKNIQVDNIYTNTIFVNGGFGLNIKNYGLRENLQVEYFAKISYTKGKVRIELYNSNLSYLFKPVGKAPYNINMMLTNHFYTFHKIKDYWDYAYKEMHKTFASVEKGCEPFFLKRIAELQQGW